MLSEMKLLEALATALDGFGPKTKLEVAQAFEKVLETVAETEPGPDAIRRAVRWAKAVGEDAAAGAAKTEGPQGPAGGAVE